MNKAALFFLLLLTGCYSANRAKMLSSGRIITSSSTVAA
jgi:hypothetical protein